MKNKLLFVSIMFSMLFVLIPMCNTSVSATWYDNGYSYRKSVSITNPAAGYQMKINITYSAGGNVTLESHCKTDFSDVRFIAQDNTTVLDYWLERKTDSSFAWFWVETNGNSILNIYYGNASATTLSSGTNTFYLFDDFNDGSIDGALWSTTGTPAESGGFMSITGTNAESIYSKTSYGAGYAIHTYGEFYPNEGYTHGEPGIGFGNDFITTDYVMLYTYSTSTSIDFYTHKNGGGFSDIALDETKTTAYKLYDIMWATSSFCSAQCNLGNIKTITNSANIPIVTIPIYIRARVAQDIFYLDYICIRKYTQVQPCWLAFGIEQTSAPPGTISLSNPVPTDGSTVTLTINVTDINSHTGDINISIQRNMSDGSDMDTDVSFNGTLIYSDDDTGNGTIYFWLFDYYTGYLVSGDTYNWNVSCSSGSVITRENFSFTVVASGSGGRLIIPMDVYNKNYTWWIMPGVIFGIFMGLIMFKRRRQREVLD